MNCSLAEVKERGEVEMKGKGKVRCFAAWNFFIPKSMWNIGLFGSCSWASGHNSAYLWDPRSGFALRV